MDLLDLLLIWPGRCGICNKLWTGRCYHPHPSGKKGEFITERVQFVPRMVRR